jgi:hypothetical protein
MSDHDAEHEAEHTPAPEVGLDDPEAPEADAAEQRAEVLDDPDGGRPGGSTPPEVDPADHAEQQLVVELDEEEYR